MKIALAKSFFIIFNLFLCITVGTAQEVCELKSKTAPLLLNLQIGMSPEQTRAVFGKDLKIKVKKKGERTFFQNYIKNPAPESLRSVRALYLRFFDGRLYQIEVFYEPRTDLKTLVEVTNALASQLNLPVADWQVENNRAEIKCVEISLVADYILNPRIELTDETVRAAIEKSRQKNKKD